jgi:carbon-monoxide dehydrogenase medium subunit
MQLFRWSDLPVALLVLDAHVGLYGPKGSRSIAVEELVATQPKRQLRPGELMNWVVVSVDKPGEGGCFVKLSMTAIDHAVASAAAKVGLEGEICRSARVAVGALAPLPQRLHEVEAALVDKPLDDGVIAEAAALTASARVVGERRADEAYKRQVAEVLVARALTAARDRAARRGEAGGPC